MSAEDQSPQKITWSFLGAKIIAEGPDAIQVARTFMVMSAYALWAIVIVLVIILALNHGMLPAWLAAFFASFKAIKSLW
jgi:hypothetical protein